MQTIYIYKNSIPKHSRLSIKCKWIALAILPTGAYDEGMKTDIRNSPHAALLREKGCKVTRGRIAILEVFAKNHKPINADYVFEKARAAKMNQVTAYRTLASFERSGILRRVDLRQDSVHYELAAHHHHHIVCTDCGVIEDFEMCNAEAVSKEAIRNSKRFSAIREHSLELFGVCNSCAK